MKIHRDSPITNRERNYIDPTFRKDGFNCAHCHVFSRQKWRKFSAQRVDAPTNYVEIESLFVSVCDHCRAPSVWYDSRIIFPASVLGEEPNGHMPEDIKVDFNEARRIASASPRGAAALLRLCIQNLCTHLGQSGTNINADIKELVRLGLPNKVQEALDSVRVIGNEAVHPGEMDLRDNKKIVASLFKLVNFICQKMITEPSEVDEIYDSLPQNKRAGIEDRDK